MSKTANRASAEVQDLFNAKAPTWNAKYRADGPLAFRVAAFQRLLVKQLPLNSKVLDLGCGTGPIASALSANGFQVTACDIAEGMIEAGKRIYAASSIEWCALPADWKQLPLDACSFDAIIASSVLEYLPNLDAVLAECQRTLKPGGILLATVPNPRTLTRKLEGFARPAAVLLNSLVGLRLLPRLHSYTTYLKHSRNRLSPAEWLAAGARAQFAVVDRVKADDLNGSLEFFMFSKAR